ncbi:MAG: 30S ribosomal protein S7 [Candidatus Gottesmanbacteria bacterium GW2011_GWA2_42_16]|nr:MAG: 30S ribosomal protein S7 [Candidatus Gottesmanbacteria bacterium GW2011_GWA2_42_16]
MARTARIIRKRQVEPEPIYNSRLVAKFINQVMRGGKKTAAAAQVYQALTLLKDQGLEPLKTFEQALNTVGPKMEVRPRRVGGASYQIPMEVRGDRRMSLAIRWMITAARKRSNKDFHTFGQKLAAEITDILKNQGEAVRKRDTIHRMADAKIQKAKVQVKIQN